MTLQTPRIVHSYEKHTRFTMKVSNPFKKKHRRAHTTDNLGFGSQTGNQGTRFMDKNGTFLIHRTGIPFFQIFDSYHWLMTASWTTFLAFCGGLLCHYQYRVCSFVLFHRHGVFGRITCSDNV